MGSDRYTREISVLVSRHNSSQDDEHDALWEDAQKRIDEIIHDPKYEPILLDW